MMEKRILILCVLLLVLSTPIKASVTAIQPYSPTQAMSRMETQGLDMATSEVLDQAQTRRDYGYWFDADDIRWQEFYPSLNNLTAIEIFTKREGNPGSLILQVRTAGGRVLRSRVFSAGSVPNEGWLRAEFSPALEVW